jgi:hypothetical protein
MFTCNVVGYHLIHNQTRDGLDVTVRTRVREISYELAPVLKMDLNKTVNYGIGIQDTRARDVAERETVASVHVRKSSRKGEGMEGE